MFGQDKERLESKISELTKSWCSLKCENLSLNEILKEKKPSDHHGAYKLSYLRLLVKCAYSAGPD